MQQELQIVLSLGALLATAAVALLSDILRNRHQRLREALVEQKVRREEERRKAALEPQPAPAPPAPEPAVEFSLSETNMTSKQVLSEWLVKRAMARAAEKAAAERRASSPEPVWLEAKPAAEPVVIDEFLWQSMMGRETPAAREADTKIPAGFHDSATLAGLLASTGHFSGLVASIGVSEGDSRDLDTFVQGLLRDTDFGCRSDRDEFIVICPGETGTEAQRHLTYLSERLWDYQLCSMNGHSVALSLGGTDVAGESLTGAVEAARERMNQTRRTRQRKQAV